MRSRSRHRFATAALAAITLVLLGAAFLPGFAQGQDQATFGVTVRGGGALSAWLDGVPGRPLTVTNPLGNSPLKGALTTRVLDRRGLGTGWDVLVSASPLTGLSLTPGHMSVIQGNPEMRGHEAFAVQPVTAEATRLWSAAPAFGDGEYALVLEGFGEAGGGDHTVTIIITVSGVSP